jgi:hypothetical protein
MYDPSTKQLVWTGTATKTLDTTQQSIGGSDLLVWDTVYIGLAWRSHPKEIPAAGKH